MNFPIDELLHAGEMLVNVVQDAAMLSWLDVGSTTPLYTVFELPPPEFIAADSPRSVKLVSCWADPYRPLEDDTYDIDVDIYMESEPPRSPTPSVLLPDKLFDSAPYNSIQVNSAESMDYDANEAASMAYELYNQDESFNAQMAGLSLFPAIPPPPIN